MQLFQNLKTFFHIFIAFLKFSSISEHFEEKHKPQTLSICENVSLIRSKLWRLFVNKLTADDKYFCHNKGNLKEPSQMQVPKKIFFFFKFSLHFWNEHQIFNILEKKISLRVYKYCRNFGLQKRCLLKCLKGPVLEHPLTVNVFTGPKHCWNLHGGIYFLLCLFPETNWVGKHLS